MKEEVKIINNTMELAECKNGWIYDEKHACWCLEDVLYTLKAVTPKFQRLSIFVPEPYMKELGIIDENGTRNGYNAKTAPVIFENNSAGYMQMPHVWLDGPRCYAKQYLEHGYVYISAGNRGHDSKDKNGNYCGKAPANLVDLKTALRFIRHNKTEIPGDFEHIISIGWSAGGAMSTLLAVTGNNKNFETLLEENGAYMDESDAVYASQIYCPIIDLEHADQAYEWMFHADKESEDSPAGPAEIMDEFKDALSAKLSIEYIRYFNALQLKNPEGGDLLVIGEDGRSGNGYDYLMKKISEAATIFLKKLEKGMLPEQYSVEDYLTGHYTYSIPEPKKKKNSTDMLQGHTGPGVVLTELAEKEEAPTLGDLMSRPAKGVMSEESEQLMIEKSGKNKMEWLFWDGNTAEIRSLDQYVLNHRRRMKSCTSFDVLSTNSGENKVFGCKEEPAMHFNQEIAACLKALKEQFPDEYNKYYDGYAAICGDKDLERRKYLINPMNFIGTDEESDQPLFYRIRVGASDADTSFSISMALACRLSEQGYNVDYQLIWDAPHSEADYPGDILVWIDKIVKNPQMSNVRNIKKKYLNIPYGKESMSQKLDLYLPEKGKRPYPVLVYIHGGGFAMGDKRDSHTAYYLSALEQGFAVAAVEYRLSGEAVFPAAVLDVREAVRYLKGHADKYFLDEERICAIGGSAGANLAVMLAMNIPNGQFWGEEGKDFQNDPFVQACVDQFGPVNFKTMDEQARMNGISDTDHDEDESPESRYLGMPIWKASPEYVAKTNPITYISDAMAPILIQHGTADVLVPFEQSKELYDAIKKCASGSDSKSEKVKFMTIEGANHDDPLFYTKENMNAIFAFIKQQLAK